MADFFPVPAFSEVCTTL